MLLELWIIWSFQKYKLPSKIILKLFLKRIIISPKVVFVEFTRNNIKVESHQIIGYCKQCPKENNITFGSAVDLLAK
jgi:hypothetical protein